MLFGVRDKEFDITFVNNYCREQYQRMLELVDELTDMPDEADGITDDEKLDSRAKMAAVRELQKRQRGIVREIADVRESIVRELLETNGHEYDAKWWSRKTDADDMNTFALGCLQKDVKSTTGGAPRKK
jgi:hypothetical protein